MSETKWFVSFNWIHLADYNVQDDFIWCGQTRKVSHVFVYNDLQNLPLLK